MTQLNNVLSDIDLFGALSPDHLTRLAATAERVVFQAGDVLIARDETCGAALLVVDGDAVVLRGVDDAPVEETVVPGALLAEMAMVVDIEASATIVARSRVRAVRLSRDAVLPLIEADPTLAEALIESITCRLRSVADTLRAIDTGLAAASSLGSLPPADARGLDQTVPVPLH